jgi:hypothetical protein
MLVDHRIVEFIPLRLHLFIKRVNYLDVDLHIGAHGLWDWKTWRMMIRLNESDKWSEDLAFVVEFFPLITVSQFMGSTGW